MTDDTMKKSYYSVIPAAVRYCAGLGKPTARDLYGEISALTNERGYCWATNNYFAKSFEVDARSVQRWLNKLEENKFVYVDNSGAQRKIFIIPFEEIKTEVKSKDKKPKKKTPKPKKQSVQKKEDRLIYSNRDLELAELLWSKIIFNFPHKEGKEPKMEVWANIIRKLKEIDGATDKQVEFMIYWIHGGQVHKSDGSIHRFKQHDFWSQNILSAKKLRQQWEDQLVPKMQASLKKTIKKATVGKL